ncbi:gephyrin-like molybdotransferase Glp [Devosia sp.]|uniref:molybdopterin molybdotransferase MoeA n=1 Tax=Devosia sp. TaxID=1871048 RepID=UPI002F016C28
MISVDEALDRIFLQLDAPQVETVPIARAHRRVLAEPLVATHTQPPFDASAMDGYAVRAAEAVPGRQLRLAGTSQAGQRFAGMMEQGQCVRIFTGAPLPIGADAVIMQEQAHADGNLVRFDKAPAAGQNIRPRGHDYRQGDELLPRGVVLTPARISLAASANAPTLAVTRRPRIALLATGDELVAPGGTPGPDQIIASNSYGLTPLLSPHADKIVDLGIIPDDRRALESALLGAFDYGVEIVVTTGGASVGDRDYVREVLIDLGVTLDFWKLMMRPGKPLMFGTRGSTLVFGLPGNPVSALVTAMVVLLPTLRQMTGHADPFWPQFGLPLAAPLPPNGPRRHYVRATLDRNERGLLQATPIAETDSSHGMSLAQADALIVQPEDDPGQPAGAVVDVIPMNWG